MFLRRCFVFRPDDASQKRFSWYSAWILKVIRVVVDQAAKRVPVIAGTGSNSMLGLTQLSNYLNLIKFEGLVLGARCGADTG